MHKLTTPALLDLCRLHVCLCFGFSSCFTQKSTLGELTVEKKKLQAEVRCWSWGSWFRRQLWRMIRAAALIKCWDFELTSPRICGEMVLSFPSGVLTLSPLQPGCLVKERLVSGHRLRQRLSDRLQLVFQVRWTCRTMSETLSLTGGPLGTCVLNWDRSQNSWSFKLWTAQTEMFF